MVIILASLKASSEAKSDLQNTVDWDRKRVAAFNVVKSQLALFNYWNDSGAIDAKIHGSV